MVGSVKFIKLSNTTKTPFPEPYIGPHMELRKSATSIAEFYIPRFMTAEGFCNYYHAARHEVELVTFETSDGREYVDLDTSRAKALIARSRRR